jgi:hypothetical protein
MKKWQEIYFNGMSNFAVVLMASGIIGLFLDEKSTIPAIVIFIAGLYFFIYTTIHAKMIEE